MCGTWQTREGTGRQGQIRQGAVNRAADQVGKGIGEAPEVGVGLICGTYAKMAGPHWAMGFLHFTGEEACLN